MPVLKGLIEKYKKLFEYSGGPEARKTFPGELNYDSGKFFIGVFITLFVWLPYITTDAALHQFPVVTIYLRAGLTVLSLALITLKLTKPLRDKPYLVLAILMGYLFIATPIITATAGQYVTAYIGGYTFVIMLVFIFPLSFAFKFRILFCSLAVFLACAAAFGMDFSNAGIRYSLTDMAGAVTVSLVLSNLNNKLRINTWEQKQVIDRQHDTIMSSINYAGKIQRNLLPADGDMAAAFRDCSVIWKPRDVVGGDIYWIRKFDAGMVLCVCDCTGHGTPGALLTMLVVSALENIVRTYNCSDTAEIIWKLDHRLSSALHVENGGTAGRGLVDICDGCDIAALFIANDGTVKLSSGKIPVFVCDGYGISQYKGQRISVGEGKLKSKDDIAVHTIAHNPVNKFYIASDGLFDQKGGQDNRQFGHELFNDIILKNHSGNLSEITAKVWDAFEQHRGDQARRDDVELVAFVPQTV